MSITFTLLQPTPENQYFQGVSSRLFGAFMESGREKAGLSVGQVAELAGVEVGQWAAMETGDWLPTTRRQFRSIAIALGVEWDAMTSIVLMCRQAWGIQ